MPRQVHLMDHDPEWAAVADAAMAALRETAPETFLSLHHIGSTSIPNLTAKPIVDLLGETADLRLMAAARPSLEALGYRWRGPNGVAQRCYLTWDDPVSGGRRIHLHVYPADDPAVAWHLAFRDRLRAEPATALAYQKEKLRCAAKHPNDSAAYTLCKQRWTDDVAAGAVRTWMKP